jgi:PKD repeat protein
LAVSFTSTSSGGLPPYSYAWTFGDGAGSTIQSPSHTYTAAGTYTANLTVTDANAATASASAVSITVIGPLSAVATASPGTGDAPFTTTLNASTTGGTSPYAFAWDLGDGSTSTAKSPDHVYSSAGTYTATVSVSDGSAQVAHSSVRVTVYTAMSVSVTASPAVGVAPVQVNFAVGASGGLAPYTFAWDYGDGIAGPGASTTHSYAAGTFHPTVTVHDAAGGTWSGSAGTISVTAPPAAQQPPPAPAPPAAPLPSPSTAPTSSPPGEPSAPPSVSTPTAPAAAPNAPSGSGALPGTGLLLMLIGSLFVTGLGGALFLGWLRRRA